MNCEKYSNLINDLVEGELDAQTAEQVNLHIFACEACEAEFETLNSEKEIYAHFLFDIEPPKDLAKNFQAKLESFEQEKTLSKVSFNERFSNIFALFTLKPLFAAAVVLLVFGFVYLALKDSNKNNEQAFVLPPDVFETPKVEVEKKDFTENPKDESAKTFSPNIEKKQFTANPKKISLKQTLPKKSLIRSPEKTEIPTENELKLKEIRAFEVETAKQIEKVELLLRSFRNARYAEDREEYDIVYEKQQARKLLENNFRLRRQSEVYGAEFTNQMLSKIEPYLLEISNLNANPSDIEVLEIKQRVKNQNIIAGLQGF
ncbi:MAG TPA: zf-HC2 domain-containing protein [Pyrinomonadaceae bacterium]|nr:zf-HC2 domain-containing protein [Pyrinomonadaceae bacterium]